MLNNKLQAQAADYEIMASLVDGINATIKDQTARFLLYVANFVSFGLVAKQLHLLETQVKRAQFDSYRLGVALNKANTAIVGAVALGAAHGDAASAHIKRAERAMGIKHRKTVRKLKDSQSETNRKRSQRVKDHNEDLNALIKLHNKFTRTLPGKTRNKYKAEYLKLKSKFDKRWAEFI